MKAEIHPTYNSIEVRCATCGNTFKTGSTITEIIVDTCASCHPFYTGEQKFASTKGRIDKFNKKVEVKQETVKKEKAEKKQKAAITDLSQLSKMGK